MTGVRAIRTCRLRPSKRIEQSWDACRTWWRPDAAFYSAKNEAAAKARGVKTRLHSNRLTKSPGRKRDQRKRWFRNSPKWRTGCEGRISVAKRRHGLNRCRYKGDAGMKRWVGPRVIADTLINIVPRWVFVLPASIGHNPEDTNFAPESS
jgi:hypothetical protein